MTSQKSQFDINHWLIRLIAYIIDSIICYIPAAIIYWVAIISVITPRITYYYGVEIIGDTPIWGGIVLLPLLAGVFRLIYFILMDNASSGTFGKRIMGLKVQTTDGSRVMISKAFIRNISKIYEPLLLLDWIIGIVTPAGDNKQKFTDRMAGTTVISTKQAFAYGVPPPPPPPPT